MNLQLEWAVHHECVTQNGIQTLIPHTSLIKYYFIEKAEHLTHSPEVPLISCLILNEAPKYRHRRCLQLLTLHIQMQSHNSSIKIYLNVKIYQSFQ